jgi:hypothetical protein
MLEPQESPAKPVTASPLNAAWLRITGKDDWEPTTATIYSCEYTDLPDQINGEVGHFHVTYSYAAGSELYTGRFVDFGRQDEEYFKRDDTVVVCITLAILRSPTTRICEPRTGSDLFAPV